MRIENDEKSRTKIVNARVDSRAAKCVCEIFQTFAETAQKKVATAERVLYSPPRRPEVSENAGPVFTGEFRIMKLTSAVLRTALSTAFFLSGAAATQASLVTYTQEALATGSLGGTGFTNALVTLKLVGDTSNVVEVTSGFFANNLGTLTLTVEGIGTTTFLGPPGLPFAFVDQVRGIGGFSRADGSLLDTVDGVFATYDLASSLGPITGPSVVRPDLIFKTALGDLILQRAGAATFTATVVTVPEPSSMALLGMGAFAGLVVRHRRRKAASAAAG